VRAGTGTAVALAEAFELEARSLVRRAALRPAGRAGDLAAASAVLNEAVELLIEEGAGRLAAALEVARGRIDAARRADGDTTADPATAYARATALVAAPADAVLLAQGLTGHAHALLDGEAAERDLERARGNLRAAYEALAIADAEPHRSAAFGNLARLDALLAA
jgi:hypothetical protein